MEVKFDLVRIGEIRKNEASEMIIRQNIGFLKSGICSLLHEIDSEIKQISICIIIPGRGHSIKIAIQDIKENHIRKELKSNFPNSIFKGEYSLVLDNINNKIH